MNRETKIALKGIIVREDKVLVAKRALTDKIGAGNWEVIGGKLEFGEDTETCLKREVREEVNLEIDIEGIIYAKNVVIDEETQMFLVVYLCRYKDGEVKLSDEHTDFKWVNKEELKTIISPEIRKDFEDNEVFELLS
ncbi:NUDIX hydrolase [Clostridium thermobutyricum]|uniref:NUDIX hydrolase n=1 Tax=Clostridium thermobutyricum TaxID=29372 RepID=UPI0018AAD2E3|nr:NUDIX domain-containing protein [Clostridium thermobutyricum]